MAKQRRGYLQIAQQDRQVCAMWDNIVGLSTLAQPGGRYEQPIKTPRRSQLRL